ncbi:hypothetical protein A3D84_02385 [Candidatus Woesebacteria bacterium RIFCSPHIGHO2_02_FULL_42_20]|uniref:Uncharacterized protein n=1 Tax=Candidatus Woesebacteria bacterium RIFCSPHIGHO2_12_FULL_41_24 TaxID=1802510 RepID=A0A1F8ASW4_9BACT|nr:MAG: hypothetical protein A2W15_00045 [Candidatus Woesebacteria bacterium RBG_16_41_13]OGM29437.1 MAG: hypothetical protein A2873_05090 [Candidatus Woesebacteria bacterium RIFCSPHIGHO2_01_FULL_42_80]OGM35016.1 MAG: hypothetical protein A3D84_02385 [Candidatus Woesebacteria bacterium RIFCSPHIGHO2_02_FULL_42_20]OGM54791.1 MAG: hypothetical protein A3E44_01380 [Candidatus Woesebacteria bacterium RIFCSPHIGHO2_12_FULL_41_24]OGM68331.1 MAG: hypothetical protein A2969_03000 [Candidatus Woesebacteri
MLGKFFDKVLHEDENEHQKQVGHKEEEKQGWSKTLILVSILVFAIAFSSRMVFLFFFTDPHVVGTDWYGDVYHHWQIALLSKEVGFSHGFLRLWDLKGLEYYWGLMHPLVLILGFIVSGSIDILVPRMVSVIFSSLAISLLFLIITRYFNKKAGFAAAIFASFVPVALFSDTLGMQEPLGLFFLLFGVFLWPRHAFFAGLTWMFAGMVRSEYWLFGAGLTLALILRSRQTHKKVILFLGYILPLVFYMKYMLDYTGNPIYPIYYNFMATVVGDWFIKDGVELSSKVLLIKSVSQVFTIVFVALGVLFLWRRPRGYLYYLVGLANLVFIFFVFGFGSYLFGYPEDGSIFIIDRNWVDRIMAWQWVFIGSIISIVLFYYTLEILKHKHVKAVGLFLSSGIFVSILLASQLSWPSISYHYTKALAPMDGEAASARKIAENYQQEGSIIVPDGRPLLTYDLVVKENIPAQKLVSALYGPFYYAKVDPFENWGDFRLEIIKWLQKEDARLFVLAGSFGLSDSLGQYSKMMEYEKDKLFTLVEEFSGFRIYRVNTNELYKQEF